MAQLTNVWVDLGWALAPLAWQTLLRPHV